MASRGPRRSAAVRLNLPRGRRPGGCARHKAFALPNHASTIASHWIFDLAAGGANCEKWHFIARGFVMSIVNTTGKMINYFLRPVGLVLHTAHPAPPTSPTPAGRDLPQLFFTDCRVLSNRIELLKALPRGGVIAEIGVADGYYSAEIFRLNQPAALHLIDPWDTDFYSKGLEVVQSKFKQEIVARSVILHHGRSGDVLPTLAKKSFDWIYLDTTHSYADTAQELRLCAPLIKDGGHIAGHDFCIGNPYSGYPFGVIQAVYEFCAEHRWSFVYITLDADGHFSFCLKQISGEQ